MELILEGLIMRVIPSATFQLSSLPSGFQMKSYSEHIQHNFIMVIRDNYYVDRATLSQAVWRLCTKLSGCMCLL